MKILFFSCSHIAFEFEAIALYVHISEWDNSQRLMRRLFHTKRKWITMRKVKKAPTSIIWWVSMISFTRFYLNSFARSSVAVSVLILTCHDIFFLFQSRFFLVERKMDNIMGFREESSHEKCMRKPKQSVQKKTDDETMSSHCCLQIETDDNRMRQQKKSEWRTSGRESLPFLQ